MYYTILKFLFVGSFIWLEDNERGATFNQKKKQSRKFLLEGYNYVKFASKKKVGTSSPLEYVQKKQSKSKFRHN
jgi:hypothetical protein